MEGCFINKAEQDAGESSLSVRFTISVKHNSIRLCFSSKSYCIKRRNNALYTLSGHQGRYGHKLMRGALKRVNYYYTRNKKDN